MEEIINSQKNILGISDFLLLARKYTENTFLDMNFEELFTQSITGKIDTHPLFRNVGIVVGNEVRISVNLMVSVLIIIIIHSIFKTIIENLGNDSSSKVAYFVQYLIIVTLVTNSFISVLEITKNTIENIIGFMNLLIPLMLNLMLATGCITSSTVVQPVLLFMINFMGNTINIFLIPLLLISVTLGIISNISDKIQIDKLSKFLKSSIIWFLGIALTIFTCVLSIEGTLSSSVDGLTAKTAKAAVSNFIPVVGKILGDAAETVIGCGNILKNSVGVIGIIIVIGIIAVPILKIAVLYVSFYLTSAVCEVVADEKIVKLIGNIADSYKILLAILFSVSVMFIVGITLVIKITNSTLMYRG